MIALVESTERKKKAAAEVYPSDRELTAKASVLQQTVRQGMFNIWRSVASDLTVKEEVKPVMPLSQGVTLKYSYPSDLPEYKPRPSKRQAYSSSSDSGSVDETIDNFTSNQDFLASTNQLVVKEGNAQISGRFLS